MSLCVERGFSFFGLVEQDYTLPDNVLQKLGFDVMEYDELEYDNLKYDSLKYDALSYDSLDYDKLDVIILRCGVIGVRKIGYI